MIGIEDEMILFMRIIKTITISSLIVQNLLKEYGTNKLTMRKEVFQTNSFQNIKAHNDTLNDT
jgi:hypothetical protein